MYFKFDLPVYEMSSMRSWLPYNSLNSVIYQDLSSFQAYMEVFSLSINVHAQNIGTQNICEESLRVSFDTGIVKKLKKFQ